MPDKEDSVPVYFRSAYDSKKRFCSYWHQIDEVRNQNPSSILEIGIGNGFVSEYLKRRNFSVTTVDIDEELHPDHVASVTDLPFEDDSFSLVMCCEVLEHLEFDELPRALRELQRVARERVIISVPDRSKTYPILFRLPRVGTVRKLIPWWRIPPMFDPGKMRDHKWEIGFRTWPLRRVKKVIQDAGFHIERTYRVFEHPRHRFFVLTPQKG